MKTLAIFGDSFASLNPSKPSSLATAWPNMIDKSRWQVTNYAEPSASFYWTYRLFLDHHSKYDQVVCIVTRPGRITMRNEPYVLGIPFSIPGYPQAEWMLEQTIQPLTPHQRRQVEIMRDYLMHVQDYEYEVDANSQLLEHLKRLRPDTIFIPNCPVLPNLCPPDHVMMMDFIRIIIASFKPEKLKEWWPGGKTGGWIEKKELDPIQCHMTPEVNALMTRCIEEALTTGVWAPQLPDKIEHSLVWEEYYESESIFEKFLRKSK
jgi:hypothetical protein